MTESTVFTDDACLHSGIPVAYMHCKGTQGLCMHPEGVPCQWGPLAQLLEVVLRKSIFAPPPGPDAAGTSRAPARCETVFTPPWRGPATELVIHTQWGVVLMIKEKGTGHLACSYNAILASKGPCQESSDSHPLHLSVGQPPVIVHRCSGQVCPNLL